MNEVGFFGLQIKIEVFYKLITSTPNEKFAYFCNISRKMWVMKLIFCLYQYLQKKVWDEVVFLHADKHPSFLQVYFNTLGVKVFYKLILSLLMVMTQHFQSTQINKFAISLQYLKKEVREGVHFLHLVKHQSSYKMVLFWRRWPDMSNVPKIGI